LRKGKNEEDEEVQGYKGHGQKYRESSSTPRMKTVRDRRIVFRHD
jgi:hypothetical protein